MSPIPGHNTFTKTHTTFQNFLLSFAFKEAKRKEHKAITLFGSWQLFMCESANLLKAKVKALCSLPFLAYIIFFKENLPPQSI
jgi:hypothetical protein